MKMQKAHFEMIAEILRDHKFKYRAYPGTDVLMNSLMDTFAERLGETNALFNTDRFLAACRGENAKDSAGRTVHYAR